MNDLGVLATMFGAANSVRKTELIRRSVFFSNRCPIVFVSPEGSLS